MRRRTRSLLEPAELSIVAVFVAEVIKASAWKWPHLRGWAKPAEHETWRGAPWRGHWNPWGKCATRGPTKVTRFGSVRTTSGVATWSRSPPIKWAPSHIAHGVFYPMNHEGISSWIVGCGIAERNRGKAKRSRHGSKQIIKISDIVNCIALYT